MKKLIYSLAFTFVLSAGFSIIGDGTKNNEQITNKTTIEQTSEPIEISSCSKDAQDFINQYNLLPVKSCKEYPVKTQKLGKGSLVLINYGQHEQANALVIDETVVAKDYPINELVPKLKIYLKNNHYSPLEKKTLDIGVLRATDDSGNWTITLHFKKTIKGTITMIPGSIVDIQIS